MGLFIDRKKERKRTPGCKTTPGKYPLSLKLFQFSPKGDYWTLGHMVRGVTQGGSPGSGKTSTANDDTLEVCCDNGFCGAYICAQPDTRTLFFSRCRAGGPAGDNWLENQ